MSFFGSLDVSKNLHIYTCFITCTQNSLKILRFVNVWTWVFGNIYQNLALDLSLYILEHTIRSAFWSTALSTFLRWLWKTHIENWTSKTFLSTLRLVCWYRALSTFLQSVLNAYIDFHFGIDIHSMGGGAHNHFGLIPKFRCFFDWKAFLRRSNYLT